MIRHEKLCEGNLSTSLLEGSEGSDAALSDCENRTVADMKLTGLVLVKNVSKKGKPAWRFLGWSSSHSRKVGRSAWLIRPCITRETRASSLVVDSGPCYHPLLSKKFYIFTDGSHTHTLPQEGEKIRSRPWDENEEEGKWKWGEDDNEMKVT